MLLETTVFYQGAGDAKLHVCNRLQSLACLYLLHGIQMPEKLIQRVLPNLRQGMVEPAQPVDRPQKPATILDPRQLFLFHFTGVGRLPLFFPLVFPLGYATLAGSICFISAAPKASRIGRKVWVKKA
jgi:hypothetical protein